MKFLIAFCAVLAFASFEAAKALDQCEACQKLAGIVQAHLASAATEHEVESLVKGYCHTLHSVADKGKCIAAVSLLVPEAFRMVDKELKNITALCDKLHFCPAKVTVQQLGSVKANPECVLCEFVMRELDSLLTKNASEQEIEAALDKVCSFLPASVRSDCVQFVDTYAPEIMKLLAQEINPSYICTLLKLCTGTESSFLGAQPRTNGPICSICTTVLQELIATATKAGTVAEVEKTLDAFCLYLSGAMRTECQAAVKNEVPKAIDELKLLKPAQVCKKMSLCAQ